MTNSAPPALLGRAADLDAAITAWEKLAADPHSGPVAYTVTGEAGMGKTSLLHAIVDRINAPTTLYGTARASAAEPHDWFAAATATYERPADTDPLAWNVLQQQPVDGPLSLPDRALLRVGVRALRLLTSGEPALIVVDDLHWLDSESLTLWAELAATRGLPAMLIAGSRDPDEAHHPQAVTHVLTRLNALANSHRCTLTGLTLPEVGQLVSRGGEPRVSAHHIRTIHRRTGGNPFWINELINAGTLTDAPLPGRLAALIRARLSDVPDSARALARTIAQLGETVDLELLANLIDEDITEEITTLIETGVLTTTPGTNGPATTLSFRHALAREAIASTVLPAESTALHARALRLAQSRNDYSGIVRHAHALNQTEVTVQAALAAGREYFDRWLSTAALDMALLGLEVQPDNIDLLELAGESATQQGDFPAGKEFYQRLIALSADPERLSLAHLRLAAVAWHEGRVGDMWTCLDRSEALAEEGSVQYARCLTGRAQALVWAEEWGKIIPLCEQAEPLAKRHGLERQVHSLAVSRSMAEHHNGDVESAVSTLEGVWRNAEKLGDLRKLARAVNNLLLIQMGRLNDDEAWDLYERGTKAVGDFGMAIHGGTITRIGVGRAIEQGLQERAWQLLHERLPIEADPTERVVLAAHAGLIAVERNEIETATTLYRRSLSESINMDKHWAVTYPQWLKIALACRGGDAAQISEAVRTYRDSNTVEEHRRRAHRAVAVACAALEARQSPTEVRTFVTQCLALPIVPGAFDEAYSLCVALRFHEGDAAGAVSVAESPEFVVPPQAPLRASILAIVGRAHQHLGNVEAARTWLLSAERTLRRWPGHRRDSIDSLLKSLPPEGVSLTAREREVLTLAAAGLANRQIARRLEISQRTVEVHVSKILAKTKTASRTEAAAWAARHFL
ncbi:ATP-binding protein [Natronoglycomyces albus]|uniref:AAA family ATPase n=1 Tax=Natronoglycomyces albus TaxID=2811108 RepID=A0A895XJI4_9ACTN|nr:helix-turn-helix transcriptional regulator [Natronoglycomyces albus]QSB03972.1 AAA family ATPase [Natronoglycomyces albus]